MNYYRPVPAPRAETQRHSLTEALPVINGYQFEGGTDGLLGGIAYTKTCDVPSGLIFDMCEPMPVEDELTEEIHERDPVTIYTDTTCINPDPAGQARAQSQLVRVEASRLAQALATASAEEMQQSFPASEPHQLATDAVSIQCGLNMIDEWGESWDMRPTVYAPRRTPFSRDWVWSPTSGDQLRTQSGARIALSSWFGEPPTGVEPVEGVAWLWATGPARILASNVVVESMRNIKMNRYSWNARRAYVIDWACAIAAVPVDMPCPEITPPPADDGEGEG